MKTTWLIAILTVVLGVALIISTSCDDDDDDNNNDDDDDDNDNDDTPDDPFCEVDEDYIEQLLGQMTLRRKIAQMYVVGAQVLPWFDYGDARRFVEEIGVGGVGIQPGTGIGLWPEWTISNTNKLQSWAQEAEYSIPLFIGCDQEGGIPQAVNDMTGGTDQPGNMGLGAIFDGDSTYVSYSIMARQLYSLGINNPYSPVVEIVAPYREVPMYMRSFGEDPEYLELNAQQSVRALRDNLIIATVKHFPGQGPAQGDDHAGRIVNYESEQTIRGKYLPPFKAAIDAGADMIMANHVVFAALDDGVPTTFSHKILTDILRGELGYQGLIMTDDMNMGAIMSEPLEEHPDVMAIAAGVDIVLDAGGDSEPDFPMHPDNLKWSWELNGQIDAVIEAIGDGRLSEERIDLSVKRILRTKMKYCLFEDRERDPQEQAQALDTPEQREASEYLFARAATLLKNENALWPLDLHSNMKLHVLSAGIFQSEMYPDAFWGNISSTSLALEVRKLYPEATMGHFDVDPKDWAIRKIVNDTTAIDPDVLIIGTFNGFHYQQQRDLVDSLLDLGIPTIMVALATPYDIMAFPDVDVYLAIYSTRTLALEIAAETIFGMRQPTGRLPVTLCETYPVGYSAYSKENCSAGVLGGACL